MLKGVCSMKKNLFLSLCFPVLLLAGCTSTLQEPEESITTEPTLEKKVVITARIGGPETRVSYFEDRTLDPEGRPYLHQQWNQGDWVYGFYDTGSGRRWLYLQVTEIYEDGGDRIAVMSPYDNGTFPESGYIHLFYCGEGTEGGPDAMDLYQIQQYNEFVFCEFELEYSPFSYSENPESPGNGNVAGLMTADAEVDSSIKDGVLTVSAEATFENQMAIIGIEGIQVDPGAVINRIEISGVRTGAVFSLETIDDVPHFVLNADGFTADQTIAVNLVDYPQADEEGKIIFDEPLFVAVYPREGGDGTEDIVLSARMSGGDEMMFNYYTYKLGPKQILKGKYYYIPTKTFEAPEMEVVQVQSFVTSEDNEEGEWFEDTFNSLEAAIDFANTTATADVYMTLLCDYTAKKPLSLTGAYENQWINLNLNGYTLTLDGCSLSADGPISLFILGSEYENSRIILPGDEPVVSASQGMISIENYVTIIKTGAGSPIQLSGTGVMSISGGRFSWNSGDLISGSSSQDSYIMGGRFSQQLTSSEHVVLGDDADEPWVSCQDGDPFRDEENRDPYCPYVLLPESVYNNLAHTSSGLLKVFSVNEWGHRKAYLTRDNLYKQNEEWAFEAPNWTGADGASNKNLFSYNELYTEFYNNDEGDFTPIRVDGGDYYWMDSSQWRALLTSRLYQDGDNYRSMPCYLKCKVQGANDAQWRNLLVFPDEFEWPIGSGSSWKAWADIENAVNDYEISWENSPVFSVAQAEALRNTGFVFLPAAVPDKDPVTFEVTGYNGGYWSSGERASYVFKDDFVGYEYQGDLNYTYLSLRVMYPCN